MENFVFLNGDWLKRCDGKRHTIGCAPKTVSRVMFAKRIRQAIEYGLIFYAGKSNLRGKTDYVLTKKGIQMLRTHADLHALPNY